MIRLAYTLGFALIFVLSGCDTRYKNQLYNGLFALTVPDYLEATSELNGDAPVQLASKEKEVYILIRYNSWEELRNNSRGTAGTLEDYYDFHIENLLIDVHNPQAPGPKPLKINGLEALEGFFSGTFKGENLYYKLVMIAGKNHLYQLIIWTTEKNRTKYEPDIEKIIASFREM
ncbi:MAG: hypothetical protein SF052_26220 [Bacteroidia bacterium]|nr:hypothetical protein [Bacteroidia bacterium]